MASPVKLAKQNAEDTWPGAVVVDRGKGHIKHQNPANLDQFMLDVQTGKHGWHKGNGPFTEADEIDTAWQPGIAPWDFEMVLSDYHAFALANFSAGQIVKFVEPISGEDMAFQPQQIQWTNDLDQIEAIANPQAVTGVVQNEDELFWAGAFGAGIDARWRNQTSRFGKGIIFAVSPPAPAQFIIDGGNPVMRVQFIFQVSNGINIWVNGVEWNEMPNNPVETQGIVEFRDDSDNILWNMNIPISVAPTGEENSEIVGTFRLRRTGPNLFVEHRIPHDWLMNLATYPIEIDPTLDTDVAAGDDDAHENENETTFSSTNGTVFLRDHGNAGFRYGGGFKFDPSSGPNQADTIDVSYIQITFSSTSFDSIRQDIHGEDVDSAADFTATADLQQRVRTSASTFWNGVNLGTTAVNSPSINSAIQEVIDRPGYSQDNPIMVIMIPPNVSTEHGRPHSYDGSSTDAATLHLEWTAAGVADEEALHRPKLAESLLLEQLADA